MTTTSMTTTCTWCCTPMMDGDLLGDQVHPGCGDPIQLPTAVTADTLGPCAACGATTTRYGDHATSTLCDTCQTPRSHP